jgi:hypothetical protein
MTRRFATTSFPLITLAALLFLSGCIPEEDPIAPFDRGDAVEATVGMMGDYRLQLYYDLGTSRVVKSNDISAWDIGFRSDTGGHQIVLNGATTMAAADLGTVDFGVAVAVGALSFRYDNPSGRWDSTAIGIWWSEGGLAEATSRSHLYIIDRGYDAVGRALGYVRLRMIGVSDSTYEFRYGELSDTIGRRAIVRRDTTRTIAAFSFDSGEGYEAEPPKGEWDLLFTRYTHLFYEPTFTPYSVTGVLLNRHNTVAAADTTRSFEEVTSASIESLPYTARADAIGYDWKVYDFTTSSFIVDSPVYIVRDSEGFAYKLRFLDFYDDQGEKGNPTFRLQRL